MAERYKEGVSTACQWGGCHNNVDVRVIPTPGSCTEEDLLLCNDHYQYMKETKMIIPEDDEEPRPAYVPEDPSCIDPTD